jgi:hypothetical protein
MRYLRFSRPHTTPIGWMLTKHVRLYLGPGFYAREHHRYEPGKSS